ncbi:MAG: phosphoribosylanthranilate isomerase [Clostridiales bacterium]|nr:phosphoribosylanthranilate isomerase [Clostridiales bacterium]
MTRIKICGLKYFEDAMTAAWEGADFLGFILSAGFGRSVRPEDVLAIRGKVLAGLAGEAKKPKFVGVFVDDSIEYIADLFNKGIIDIAQLHGDETEEYIASLREKIPEDAGIWKVFLVRGAEEIEKARRSPADMVLLDSGIGGTGKTFDWSLLQNMTRPFILAGGLDPVNVGESVARINPWCVDTSSGVEEKDGEKGKKKAEKIVLFIRNVWLNSNLAE